MRAETVARRCAAATAGTIVAGAAFALPAAAQDGGAYAAPQPTASSVRCLTKCTAVTAVRPGGTVRVSGRNFSGPVSVVFLGRSGQADDATARGRARDGAVVVRLPSRARTGPVQVRDSTGLPSIAGRAKIVVDRSTPLTSRSGIKAELDATRVNYYGRQRAGLTYVLQTSGPRDVRVDLVRLSDGTGVASWTARDVQPGTPRTVRWSGTMHGRVQPAGRYQFRLTVGELAAGARSSADAMGDGRQSTVGAFIFRPYVFPIRGPHQFGLSAGRFGAGRSGHSHQGQDTFARCGTRLVAARGGRVQYEGWQGAAGNYIVIDGAGTTRDFMYAHMRSRALVRKGDRVYTGQTIGYVGDTGDAQGCHLHFEIWTAPGWYQGGSPIDPLPSLRAWDRVS